MPVYNIVYTELYKEDVLTVHDWYYKMSPELSDRFIGELKESEGIILAKPNTNARFFNTLYRRYLMPVFPYKIAYKIKDKDIFIIALIHTARSNKFIKRRLRK